MPARYRSCLAAALRSLCCIAICFFGAARAAEQAPSPPPVAAFFSPEDIRDTKLSPSGRWLAMLVLDNGRHALAIVDLSNKEPQRIVARSDYIDLRSFNWVGDDRLVFDLIDHQLGAYDQRRASGLLVVDRTNGHINELISTTGRSFQTGSHIVDKRLGSQDWLIEVPAVDSDNIIIGEPVTDSRDDLRAVNALRLNVVTRQTQSLSRGRPDNAVEWLFDPQGEPRLIVSEHAGNVKVHWRAPGDDTWRQIAEFPSLHRTFQPIEVDGAGQLFVTTASGQHGTTVLKRFDFKTGHPDPEPLVSTPGFDFDGRLRLDQTTLQVVGVEVLTDALTTVWLNPAMKALQKIVDDKLPGHVNVLTCKQCNTPDAVVLVHSWSDREPGAYWIYRPASDAWTGVGRVRLAIEPSRMAQVDLHRIQARDGEDLPVWVTTPPEGANRAGQAAAVVLVHGGPWTRGTAWNWSADAQFLASRGYVVIEPEFRGSTGFGTRHEKLGWKHWGDTMQDDLQDAVRWAAGKGLVDPKRICIAGASYGGYATLMSLVRHPESYRCGIAWAAVTDPRLLYMDSWESDISAEWMSYGLPTVLGDLQADAGLLAAATPVEHAGAIKAPLLLAFGADDHRVPLVHGTRMRDALRAAGNDPEWVVYTGEGHGWLKTENKVDFWSRVERFLAKNLAPQSP